MRKEEAAHLKEIYKDYAIAGMLFQSAGAHHH